jgi:hypothetical protein
MELQSPAQERVRLLLTASGLHHWEMDDAPSAERLWELVAGHVDLPTTFSLGGSTDTISAHGETPYCGYLPFFQLNMLLAGLHNPAYKPGAFFREQRGNSDAGDVRLWQDVIAPTVVQGRWLLGPQRIASFGSTRRCSRPRSRPRSRMRSPRSSAPVRAAT